MLRTEGFSQIIFLFRYTNKPDIQLFNDIFFAQHCLIMWCRDNIAASRLSDLESNQDHPSDLIKFLCFVNNLIKPQFKSIHTAANANHAANSPYSKKAGNDHGILLVKQYKDHRFLLATISSQHLCYPKQNQIRLIKGFYCPFLIHLTLSVSRSLTLRVWPVVKS